ncbi:MAG: siderophore-interacting protein [Bdellovibrionaceae bacterium]|nr:siderophore-interacting protein [Pseudobdellovibrionaceae bacterium]
MEQVSTLNTAITRLKHDVKIRKLTVTQIMPLSPLFTKITFFSEDLKDFVTASPDDHVKVFFPDPETGHYSIPRLGPEGLQTEEGQPEPLMRDYTPLNYNSKNKTLELIFFMRDKGAGALWAQKAKEGDELFIAGPRGSFVLSYIFDWYLILTDESGLPSLQRRLQEMPKDAKGLVLAEISKTSDAIKVQTQNTPQGIEIQWLERTTGQKSTGSSDIFLQSLNNFTKPEGNGFVWIKTESYVALQLKNYILQNNITKDEWIKASGYWKRTRS